MDEKGELLSIHSHEPTLGDIFIEVTGRDYNDIFNETCISYFRKEVQDFKTNSQVLLMASLPIIFAFIYSRFGQGSAGVGIITLMAFLFVAGFVQSMVIAEEKEKHTLRVLMLSPASSVEVLLGKVY